MVETPTVVGMGLVMAGAVAVTFVVVTAGLRVALMLRFLEEISAP